MLIIFLIISSDLPELQGQLVTSRRQVLQLRGGDGSRVELLRAVRAGDGARSTAQTCQAAVPPCQNTKSSPLGTAAAAAAATEVAGPLRTRPHR